MGEARSLDARPALGMAPLSPDGRSPKKAHFIL
jgi:hypothetical protein